MGYGGYVLAGGQSRRMGQDKAWLPYRGKPLAAWLAEEVKAAAGTVVLVGHPKLYSGLGLSQLRLSLASCTALSMYCWMRSLKCCHSRSLSRRRGIAPTMVW